MRRASSSLFASIASAMRMSIRPRSRGGTSFQVANAFAAACTARSTSPTPARGTSAIVRRWAGFSTGRKRPSALASHLPSMSMSLRSVVASIPCVLRLSAQLGAALFQKLPEYRAVAARLVLAIAADREIRRRRQRREHIQNPARRRRLHLLLVLLRKRAPCRLIPLLLRLLTELYQRLARRKVRQP